MQTVIEDLLKNCCT